RLVEQQRQERLQQVLSRAQSYLRDERFEEAAQVLEGAPDELKASEISALLATVRDRRDDFERRREEIITSARQLLQSDEAAKAVALFELAPKSYFKNENFQRVYSECRQDLDRVNFVNTAA